MSIEGYIRRREHRERERYRRVLKRKHFVKKNPAPFFLAYPEMPLCSEPGASQELPLKTQGIYCFWDIQDNYPGQALYVGKSRDLRSRIKSHKHFYGTFPVTWVEIPGTQLEWAECFYIGTLRPYRNFDHI